MGFQAIYDPDRDIPDLAGKVIFITGGMSLTTSSLDLVLNILQARMG